MTKDDIIRMAHKAGFEELGKDDWVCFTEEIECFAALIAAYERKECAKMCDELWEDDATAFDCAVAIRKRGKA